LLSRPAYFFVLSLITIPDLPGFPDHPRFFSLLRVRLSLFVPSPFSFNAVMIVYVPPASSRLHPFFPVHTKIPFPSKFPFRNRSFPVLCALSAINQEWGCIVRPLRISSLMSFADSLVARIVPPESGEASISLVGKVLQR